MNPDKMRWVRRPEKFNMMDGKVEIITSPRTDLWQRTYYGFRNDNAPLLLLDTRETFFSFTVKTEFASKRRFDQCGVAVYIDSENWLKASIEYENEQIQRLGSVVTNNGYSDWATTDIASSVKSMFYRLSRRQNDFCIENSLDGTSFQQMRICHLFAADGPIPIGIYACSPEDSSFRATFSDFVLSDCLWQPHS